MNGFVYFISFHQSLFMSLAQMTMKNWQNNNRESGEMEIKKAMLLVMKSIALYHQKDMYSGRYLMMTFLPPCIRNAVWDCAGRPDKSNVGEESSSVEVVMAWMSLGIVHLRSM